jgi:hypothetical protein
MPEKFTQVIFAIIIFYCVFAQSLNIPKAVARSEETYKIRIQVRVLDIDQKNSNSSIELMVRLGPLPREFNKTEIFVQIHGGGYVMLTCKYVSNDTHGKYFEGSISCSWSLSGFGELFPFDYYYMTFNITPLMDATFKLDEVVPVFYGPKQRSLWDTWETNATRAVNELFYYVDENEKLTLNILIKRKPIVPYVAFIIPIILCYFVLSATLFLDPKSKMQEILTIYLSLFVFIPQFFIGIQAFLPYKSLLTIPEILLTNLITSLSFFGVSTILSEYWGNIKVQGIGVIFALIFFIIYYCSYFLQILLVSPSIETISWVFTFVVLCYAWSAYGFIQRLRRKKEKPLEKDHSTNLLLTSYV